MQYWGESCNACWWAGVPVIRRDPVDSYEPVDDGDLRDAYRVPRSGLANALLPVGAGRTGEVDWLAEAGSEPGDVEEVLLEAERTAERGHAAQCKVTY